MATKSKAELLQDISNYITNKVGKVRKAEHGAVARNMVESVDKWIRDNISLLQGLIAEKQDKRDDALGTTEKTVAGAINEMLVNLSTFQNSTAGTIRGIGENLNGLASGIAGANGRIDTLNAKFPIGSGHVVANNDALAVEPDSIFYKHNHIDFSTEHGHSNIMRKDNGFNSLFPIVKQSVSTIEFLAIASTDTNTTNSRYLTVNSDYENQNGNFTVSVLGLPNDSPYYQSFDLLKISTYSYDKGIRAMHPVRYGLNTGYIAPVEYLRINPQGEFCYKKIVEYDSSENYHAFTMYDILIANEHSFEYGSYVLVRNSSQSPSPYKLLRSTQQEFVASYIVYDNGMEYPQNYYSLWARQNHLSSTGVKDVNGVSFKYPFQLFDVSDGETYAAYVDNQTGNSFLYYRFRPADWSGYTAADDGSTYQAICISPAMNIFYLQNSVQNYGTYRQLEYQNGQFSARFENNQSVQNLFDFYNGRLQAFGDGQIYFAANSGYIGGYVKAPTGEKAFLNAYVGGINVRLVDTTLDYAEDVFTANYSIIEHYIRDNTFSNTDSRHSYRHFCVASDNAAGGSRGLILRQSNPGSNHTEALIVATDSARMEYKFWDDVNSRSANVLDVYNGRFAVYHHNPTTNYNDVTFAAHNGNMQGFYRDEINGDYIQYFNVSQNYFELFNDAGNPYLQVTPRHLKFSGTDTDVFQVENGGMRLFDGANEILQVHSSNGLVMKDYSGRILLQAHSRLAQGDSSYVQTDYPLIFAAGIEDENNPFGYIEGRIRNGQMCFFLRGEELVAKARIGDNIKEINISGGGSASVRQSVTVESFPFSTNEGARSIDAGVCSFVQTNHTSGSFQFAIYKASDRNLVTQTVARNFSDFPIGEIYADFDETVVLEANTMYYVCMFINHTDSRYLMAKRFRTELSGTGDFVNNTGVFQSVVQGTDYEPNSILSSISRTFPNTNQIDVPYIKIF